MAEYAADHKATTAEVNALELLWLVGTCPPSVAAAGKSACSRPRVPAHLDRPASARATHGPVRPCFKNHGGYARPWNNHRGAPPTYEDRCRRPFTPMRPDSAATFEGRPRPRSAGAIASPRLRPEEGEDDAEAVLNPEDLEDPSLVGARCSLIMRMQGKRVADYGAKTLEDRADKAAKLLQITGHERKEQLMLQQEQLRQQMLEARERQRVFSDEAAVKARRRAADILSELHTRTIKGEIQRKNEAAWAAANSPQPVTTKETKKEKEKKSWNSAPDFTWSRGEGQKAVLQVQVIRATKLASADWNGLSDPYCVIEIEGKSNTQQKTSVKPKTLNPVWNETLHLKEYRYGDVVTFKIYDHDLVKGEPDMLGETMLDGDAICSKPVNTSWKEELQLEDIVEEPVKGREKVSSPKHSMKAKIPSSKPEATKKVKTMIEGVLTVELMLCTSDGQPLRREEDEGFRRLLGDAFRGPQDQVLDSMRSMGTTVRQEEFAMTQQIQMKSKPRRYDAFGQSIRRKAIIER